MRVWFNHWFSTAYYFIESAKKYGYYVISSNERDSCVYTMNSDEFFLEPVLNDEDYLNWSLDFCRKNNIDIFFCKKYSKIISKNINLFNCIVIVEDYDNIVYFESKINGINFFKKNNISNTPEAYLVNNYDDFICRYSYLKNKYNDVCMKKDVDEGGQSFRRISSNGYNYDDMFSYSLEESLLLKTIRKKDKFDDILIMPYLKGTEYSIDCLNTKNGLIAIPRVKLSNRVTSICKNEKLINIVKNFQSCSNLSSAYNIQFREDENGILYLLDINTRLAGGSWKDTLIGVDFVDLIIREELNIKIDVDNIYNNFNDIILSNLENIIVLK